MRKLQKIKKDTRPKKEFHVEVRRQSYGYVRILARDKNEARRVVEQMEQKRILQYYKERFELLKVGKATKPSND